jgi:hypothetical protein
LFAILNNYWNDYSEKKNTKVKSQEFLFSEKFYKKESIILKKAQKL